MESQKPISSGTPKSPPMPVEEFLQELNKWMIVFTHVYRQPMTEATVWAYRETLCDLSVAELERGCKEAMRQTRFTPTPAEIREYGIIEGEHYGPALNALPPAPPMTDAECKEFLAKLRKEVPCLTEGVIEITDKMRERHEKKKAQLNVK